MKRTNPVEHAWSTLYGVIPRPASQAEAIVSRDITPGERGQVKCFASYWPALCQNDCIIRTGQHVRLLYRKGNTWIVEPIETAPNAS